MEKPAWLLKQQQLCQPRSRHMSINEDYRHVHHVPVHPRSAATPIPEGKPVQENRYQRIMPSSLPPYAGHHMPGRCMLTPEKSRTPSGGSADSEADESSEDDESQAPAPQMTEEFPYGAAFKAAMGRVTAFPDGTEAVMIDSALALEAFQQMVINSWNCYFEKWSDANRF